MLAEIYKRLEEIYPEIVHFRREMHMYPELSFEEVETPEKIAEYLKNIGIEVKESVGGRGIVGILRGGKPGKTVALRADFDALPIQDEKEVEYKSRIPGVMHACGHDIHTAALLGTAKVLSEMREVIPGNVVFIHQFAEEKHPGGAIEMIKDGCLEGVDVIYGAHVVSDQPIGEIGVREGYMTSAPDSFEISIQGKGGHGGWPHRTVDPLVTACQLVVNLQQIVSRQIDPLHPAVLSVCTFKSGNASNVIPENAIISGTVRTTDINDQEKIEKAIHQISNATCQVTGAIPKVRYVKGYPAINNDSKETKRIEKLGKAILGEEKVIHIPLIMGGEDFAHYLHKVPGTFFVVGGRNPEINAIYNNHHPLFDVDERSMLIIGKIFVSAVFNYLSNETIEPNFD